MSIALFCLLAWIAPIQEARAEKTSAELTPKTETEVTYEVISSKNRSVVVEGDVSKIQVGDLLQGPNAVSGKVVLLRAGMVLLEVESSDGIKAGDRFRFVNDPAAAKRAAAEKLIAEAAPVVSPKPEMVAPVGSGSWPRLDNFGYLPPAGHFYIESSIIFSTRSYSYKGTTGIKLLDVDNSSGEIPLLVGYALSDSFLLGFQEKLQIRNEDKNTSFPSGVVTRENREGLSDLNLGFIYRFYENPAEGTFGKMLGFTSLPLSKNRPPQGLKSGNNARGGIVLGVNTDFSWLSGRHEWSSGLDLNYFGKSNVETTPRTTIKSIFAARFRGAYRFHANEVLFLQPEIGLTLPYTTEETSGSSILTVERPLTASLSGMAGLNLNPQLLAFLKSTVSGYSADGSLQSGGSIADGSLDVSIFSIAMGFQASI